MSHLLNQSLKSGMVFVSVMLMIQPALAQHASYTQVDRYLVVKNKPLPEQQNLMLQTVQVHFPIEVKTLGDALNYLLKPSGYTLHVPETASVDVKKMLTFTLPLVDRDLGPLNLQDALKTLAGESFTLKVNRLTREVSFESHLTKTAKRR